MKLKPKQNEDGKWSIFYEDYNGPKAIKTGDNLEMRFDEGVVVSINSNQYPAIYEGGRIKGVDVYVPGYKSNQPTCETFSSISRSKEEMLEIMKDLQKKLPLFIEKYKDKTWSHLCRRS